ncbi:MAG: permease [Paracoccaceae bacterium]|nr:permease [Paracoccaceae bacterium]
MADLPVSAPRAPVWTRIDKVWALVFATPLVLLAIDRQLGLDLVADAGASLWGTLPFIAFAVAAVAYLKATGAEAVVAKAFQGSQPRMILLAALAGGLAPFCSCEVIPFIAALLALGAPLSAVMAFWLSSPLMDPAQFAIVAGTLGAPFAIGKTIAAVFMGLVGGTAVALLSRSAVFADPLRERPAAKGCGCGPSPFDGTPVWAFWSDADRRASFRATAIENALFLLKWLSLAYLIEAMMVRWVPAELVASVLGGEGPGPVILGALVGAPAYLNGYAAVPLVDALLQQGMSQGAAMSFMLAGGASSIPAALAVWALVKPRVFGAYLGIAVVGSIAAGLAWGLAA